MTTETSQKPRRRETSLRRRLILLLALAILPIGLVGVITAIYSYERERQDFLKDVELLADFVASERDKQLTGAYSVLVAITSRFEAATARTPACRLGMKRTLDALPTYTNLAYLDARGDLVCAAFGSEKRLNFASAPWFRSALAGQNLSIGHDRTARGARRRVVVLTIPVRSAKTRIDGVMGASIALQKMREMPEALRGQEDARTAILDPVGKLIVAAGAGVPDWLPAAERLRVALSRPASIFMAETRGGERYMYATRRIALDRAVSILAIPAETRERSIWLNFAGVAALPILMWISAIAAAWFGLDRLVVGPLTRLRRVARAYASGHLSYREPENERAAREFRDLTRDFNKMAGAVQERTKALEDSLEQNRSLVREIHHRVKNNLQLIASILNARARATTDEDEKELLAEIGNRVRALAIVHAEYRGPDQGMAIDLGQVLETMVAQHRATFGEEFLRIVLTADDPCWVSIDDAVPSALLVSELLSAAREGGEADEPGLVTIDLDCAPDQASLTIEMRMQEADRLANPRATVTGRLIDALSRQISATVDPIDSERMRVRAILTISDPNIAPD